MIKSAIATAVVAATTVTTIADVKVYGRVRVAAVCTDDGTNSECALEDRSSRFGIKASSEISDGLTAFGRYEFRVNAERASLASAAGAGGQRLSYVGIKGGFGEVSLGTRWSPLYLHTASYVDPTNAFGGTWNSGAGYNTDFRNTHTLNYKNKFGAASVGVQLQMAPGTGEEIDEATIGGSMKLGSATIGAAYQDTTNVASIAAIHARSKFGAFSVGGTYSSRSEDGVGADNDAIIVAAGYGMGGGKSITLTYGQTDIDGGNTPTEIGLEYVHNMGAGFKWYAGFSSADPDTAADNTDRYGAGMRYDF